VRVIPDHPSSSSLCSIVGPVGSVAAPANELSRFGLLRSAVSNSYSSPQWHPLSASEHAPARRARESRLWMMECGMPGWSGYFTSSFPRISALELFDIGLVGRINRR
jgi:hypothetical protein